MIKLALPNKGQLFEPAMELLRNCGYKVSKNLKSLTSTDAENNVEFYFLRPGDIPMYVGEGIIDLGITGLDFNAEKRSPAVKILDLHFGASKMCAAVPNSSGITALAQLKDLRIATSFPNITRQYFGDAPMNIVELEGAVEISVGLGIADAIVDVVETGTTLKQAGLRVIGEPLFVSSAALFSHPGRESAPELQTMVKRIEGKLVALSYMMVEYDAPAHALKEACALTPGIASPTVIPLQDPNWYSVKAMIRKSDAHRTMDQLSDLGCKGIVLFQMESARI
jgi:ATP phosphoribosyltransferase